MASAPVQAPDQVPSEDRELYQRLAKLQDIYSQVFELRTLLPDKLVYPTREAVENPSTIAPQKVAAQLKGAAVTGSKNIKAFKKDFQSEDMRSLWQKVNSSEFPQGQDVWTRNYAELVKSLHVDWGNLIKEDPDQKPGLHPTQSEETNMLTKFREQNSTISVRSLDEGRALPLEITINDFDFLVEQSTDPKEKSLRVGLAVSKPAGGRDQDILKHIANEHSSEELESMLNLLASYKDAKATPCQRCGKVFDTELQLPLNRQRKEGASSDTSAGWFPLHQSCAS